MTRQHELEAIASAIVDSNSYMTLGRADADGHPWASVCPELSLVIFDSRSGGAGDQRRPLELRQEAR